VPQVEVNVAYEAPFGIALRYSIKVRCPLNSTSYFRRKGHMQGPKVTSCHHPREVERSLVAYFRAFETLPRHRRLREGRVASSPCRCDAARVSRAARPLSRRRGGRRHRGPGSARGKPISGGGRKRPAQCSNVPSALRGRGSGLAVSKVRATDAASLVSGAFPCL
jgi:hypothetical protein